MQDSVMIDTKLPSVNEAILWGRQAATQVTRELFNFDGVVNLAFEKVFLPYLIINKKRYAGLKYTDIDKHEEHVSCSGLESARRDSCPLVADVISRCLDVIFMQDNLEGIWLFFFDFFLSAPGGSAHSFLKTPITVFWF